MALGCQASRADAPVVEDAPRIRLKEKITDLSLRNCAGEPDGSYTYYTTGHRSWSQQPGPYATVQDGQLCAFTYDQPDNYGYNIKLEAPAGFIRDVDAQFYLESPGVLDRAKSIPGQMPVCPAVTSFYSINYQITREAEVRRCG